MFDDMNRMKTHMIIVHDTAPTAPPKIGKIVAIWKITGGERREAGGWTGLVTIHILKALPLELGQNYHN